MFLHAVHLTKYGCSSLFHVAPVSPWRTLLPLVRASGQPLMPCTSPPRCPAGVDSALVELREVVACLKDSRRLSRLSAKMPSGVLLVGPPGEGRPPGRQPCAV